MASAYSSIEYLYSSFNQTEDCVAFGTKHGFYIYTLNPFEKIFAREIPGGISIIKILFKSNIYLFVGNTKSGLYPNNKLIIWNDHSKKVMGEINFRERIIDADLNKDKIVVICERKIFIYNFRDISLFKSINTTPNPKGLFSFSLETSSSIAYPSDDIGSVNITDINTDKITNIQAHTSNLEFIKLSHDGNYIATASERGTIIRIYHVNSSSLIKELRRGSDPASISDITFNKDNSMLCVSSDKGTIHLFNTSISDCPFKNSIMENYGISYIKSLLPGYFHSEWSFSQQYLPETNVSCAFSDDNKGIHVIANSGNYYFISIDDTGKTNIDKNVLFVSDENDPFSNRTNTIR